jgi:amino acid adenylation domain-containing protein
MTTSALALAPQPRRLTSAMHRKKKVVGRKVGDEAVVVTATGLVSVLNYGYTLILLWLLPTREFAAVASISALLLICGTVAGAALPWVLAQEVLRSKRDRTRRRLAVTFCLFATVLQGAAAGLATCLIAAHYASGPVVIAAFASVFLIFMAATASGYFQGLQSFRLIATLRVGEVVVKIGAGVGLIALGAGASGAIAGFALGAGLVAGGGLVYMVHDMEFSRKALAGRNLWASTQGLLAIQAGVAVLASMDVVIGSLVLGAQPALATYQAANIIGRIPVFIGAALSIVVFPRMVSRKEEPSVVIKDSVKLYVKLCVPICLIVVTLPHSITSMLFPARYGDVDAVLPWTAAAGLLMGVVNLTTTYFQATGLFRRATKLLAAGVALCAALDVFGLENHGIVGLAIAVFIGATVVAILLLREIARTWPGSLRGLWRPTLVVAVACAPLLALRRHEGLWVLWSLGVLAVFSARGLLAVARAGGGGGGGGAPGPGGGGPGRPPRPKVLHLGYEDPRRPGAGGGSVRTHEINRRLADRYDITVVCARYRGCRPRVEDGVHYVHSGVAGGGDFLERLAYFATIPLSLLRYRSDLVVEDFGAPFSSVAVPWMTRRPVIGVVQWLFAVEKSKQYHLPFAMVESIGVRSHRRLVAVSDDLGAVLAGRNPAAEVTVVANGLDSGAFATYEVPRRGIGYLGRLEIAQKGLDLLLESYARVAGSVDQDLYLAGDGPDRRVLAEMTERLGIAERVHFVGRVPADERFEWLAGCDLVAMPSRYETFGMVAAEALAVRTPVVAFDIPCLRALVDDSVGARVAPFSVEEFACALESMAASARKRRRLGEGGPARVAKLNWDELADAQGGIYAEVLGRARSPRGKRAKARTAPHARPVIAPVGLSVVEQLRAQLQATPSAPAVVDGEVTWSYEVLHGAVETAVEHLAIMGVEPGQRVGVCLPRSKEAIAAMVGIWAMGAVYVPLDPEYPAARLRDLCERAEVTVAFAARASALSDAPGLTRIDPSVLGFPIGAARSRSGFDSAGSAVLGSARTLPTLDDPAYVLFTSGSSGQPKGVQVPHRGLATVLQWVRATLSLEELASTATTISFSFDPFILEVLGPLVTGGVVHTIPTALALADQRVDATMLANTPSVLTELLRAGRLPSTLRTIISGGENLSGSLATELLTRTSITRLINTYGPTETTVLATAHEVTGPVTGPVPIGRALPGANVVLLDDEDREVQRGEKGEICIFGAQLADGYVGAPTDSDRRFAQWTDGRGRTQRIYRSGDLGRRDRRGVITFCGRKDRQVKLRGFRIEPGEVEVALAGHPEIGQAFVTAEGSGARATLVAYVTTESDTLSAHKLRQWLGHSLPQFMVPAQFVMMRAFPTTANGKLEVDRLPTWRAERGRMAPSPAGTGGPGDARVGAVARLAGEIIGFEGTIGGGDDFFDDLGGSSLGLFQLLSSLEKEFHCTIEIGRVLEDTTIAGLASMIGAVGDDPLYVSVNADGGKSPVYMIHAYLGTALRYRRLGQYLPADRPLVGIQVQAFDGESVATRTTVDELAAEAVAQIRALQPHGPYVVGGHSAGGLVAYEAARRLAADGQELPLVILLDSPVPRSSLHYLWAESVMNWPDIKAASFAERRRRMAGLVTSRRGKLGGPTGDDRVDATITRSYRSSNQAVKHYRPGPYDGDVAVMRTRQGMSMAVGKGDLGWAPYVSGNLTTVEIPGLHNTIFEDPQLEVIGAKLSSLLDAVEPDAAVVAEVVVAKDVKAPGAEWSESMSPEAERSKPDGAEADGAAVEAAGMVDRLMADAASIDAALADFSPGDLPLPSVLRRRRSPSRPGGVVAD